MRFYILALACFMGMTQEPKPFTEYLGTYTFEAGSAVPDVTIVAHDSVLQVISVNGNADLRRVRTDSFVMVAYPGSVAFRRDTAKLVNGLTLYFNDLVMDGKKAKPAKPS